MWKFEKLVAFSRGPYTLPLRNPSPELGLVPPGDWVQQDKGTTTRGQHSTRAHGKLLGKQEPEFHKHRQLIVCN